MRSEIVALGYLGLNVANPGRWTEFLTHVLGLEFAGQASDGAAMYRMDERSARLFTLEGVEDDIAFLGLEASNKDALDSLCERLSALGFLVRPAAEETREARGVTDLRCVEDPEGLRIELYLGQHTLAQRPFRSPSLVGGFVTGAEGLGHVVLRSADRAAQKKFWIDGLGFGVSDFMSVDLGPAGSAQVVFMHCNRRHHSVALAAMALPKRLMHFMIEAQSIDDVGFALDRAKSSGAPIAAELGRHSNDHMISFYVQTPSGWEVEFGFGGRLIDPETWAVEKYTAPSIWGHGRTKPL